MQTYPETDRGNATSVNKHNSIPAESEPMPAIQHQPPEDFRIVLPQEIVVSGDFIMNPSQELEPWEGPNGFRADSFVMPVYRPENPLSTSNKRRG